MSVKPVSNWVCFEACRKLHVHVQYTLNRTVHKIYVSSVYKNAVTSSLLHSPGANMWYIVYSDCLRTDCLSSQTYPELTK